MTVEEWLRNAKVRLAAIGAPQIEADLLLGFALGKDRPWILSHGLDRFDPSSADEVLSRRLTREPLAYILGRREFYGRHFLVDPSVLIPRHETEVLVDAGLAAIDQGATTALDLCSGSGAIGITLKLERPQVSVSLADLSPSANEVAERNARTHRAEVTIIQSDLFSGIDRPFDLILCNPPYIARNAELAPEVANHEPEIALFAEDEGYAMYRAIASQAHEYLSEHGQLWLELGDHMSVTACELFDQAQWRFLGLRRDLLGIDRILGVSPT